MMVALIGNMTDTQTNKTKQKSCFNMCSYKPGVTDQLQLPSLAMFRRKMPYGKPRMQTMTGTRPMPIIVGREETA